MQIFKIGDKVRVRQWDDMAKEYGTYTDAMGEEHICFPSIFVQSIKYLCGKTGTIISVGQLHDDKQWLQIDMDEPINEYWSLDNGSVEYINNAEEQNSPKIIITTDGKRTTAMLYKDDVKVDSASSYYDIGNDLFGFKANAQIAINKLLCPSAKPVKEKQKKEYNDNAIHEGDCVCVIDNNYSYLCYTRWILKYAPDYAIYFAYGYTPREDGYYDVIAKAPHESPHYGMLYFIRSRQSDSCYLINEKGIKKAEV